MNAHHNLSWSGLQIGNILQLHHFRTAELVHSNRLHHFLPCALSLTQPPHHKRMFASNCSTSAFLSAVRDSNGKREVPP